VLIRPAAKQAGRTCLCRGLLGSLLGSLLASALASVLAVLRAVPRVVLRAGRAAAAARGCAALAGAACLAVAVSGCGTAPAGPVTGANRTVVAEQAVGSPRQQAVTDAARIIASFPRPPHGTRTGLIAELSVPAVMAVSPDLVEATEWWRVPGQPQAVLAWVQANIPARFTLTGGGGGDYQPTRSITVSGTLHDVFTLPAVPNVLIQRWLVVLVAPDGNQTAMRVDAEDVWLPAKPAEERIPPDAKVVTVAPIFEYSQYVKPSRVPLDPTVAVTNPATVARIAALVDALTVFPPGFTDCEPGPAVQVQLTFRTSLHGRVVALVSEAGCSNVSVTIDGQAMPALSDDINAQRQLNKTLGQRVLAIAAIRWPYQPIPPTLP
jgi:hypothetical protein